MLRHLKRYTYLKINLAKFIKPISDSRCQAFLRAVIVIIALNSVSIYFLGKCLFKRKGDKEKFERKQLGLEEVLTLEGPFVEFRLKVLWQFAFFIDQALHSAREIEFYNEPPALLTYFLYH